MRAALRPLLALHLGLLTLFHLWPAGAAARPPGPERPRRAHELCDSCRRVLGFAFAHYEQLSSRRLLRHKLRHLCKRYYAYRRHCLGALASRAALVADHMDQALRKAPFDATRLCAELGDCPPKTALSGDRP